MLTVDLAHLWVQQIEIDSSSLKRKVAVDIYIPKQINDPSELSLLLINDGQNLPESNFGNQLDQMTGSGELRPLFCAGIHAGWDRRNEYGTAKVLDFMGRGVKAGVYQQFIIQELLPVLHKKAKVKDFRQKGCAGFSLGGLSALDMTWNYPEIFSIAGVFSGSLWWRKKSLDDDYNDHTDRIMHQLIRQGTYHSHLRFYFMTGSLDEKADRNQNGIIDSIDDTLALIDELKHLGYKSEKAIYYMNDEEGRHDMVTWGKAMPHFLKWGWGRSNKEGASIITSSYTE